MPWVGFEPTISAGERPRTNALDRAATGTGIIEVDYFHKFPVIWIAIFIASLPKYAGRY